MEEIKKTEKKKLIRIVPLLNDSTWGYKNKIAFAFVKKESNTSRLQVSGLRTCRERLISDAKASYDLCKNTINISEKVDFSKLRLVCLLQEKGGKEAIFKAKKALNIIEEKCGIGKTKITSACIDSENKDRVEALRERLYLLTGDGMWMSCGPTISIVSFILRFVFNNSNKIGPFETFEELLSELDKVVWEWLAGTILDPKVKNFAELKISENRIKENAVDKDEIEKYIEEKRYVKFNLLHPTRLEGFCLMQAEKLLTSDLLYMNSLLKFLPDISENFKELFSVDLKNAYGDYRGSQYMFGVVSGFIYALHRQTDCKIIDEKMTQLKKNFYKRMGVEK